MTVHAIAGLFLFNVLVLGAGTAVLWGLGAIRWWTDALRLGGVAYFAGIGALMVLLSLELALGIPVGMLAGSLELVVLAATGLALGLARRRPRPALRPPGWRAPRLSVFVALFLAGIVVYLEALFRQARLSSTLPEWDGWWNWVPKAKAIYFSGRLDFELLAFLPNQSYPPGLPAVHALGFHFMGSADDVTLHLQYWFYAVAFVATVLGLLADRVRQAILVPLLFFVLLAPSFVTRFTWTYADLPLGYLVATAALLLSLWIHDRASWQLVAAVVVLAGAMLTKREGILLALCLLLAALVASWAERRSAWPRLALAGAAALALAAPWRIWFALERGAPGDTPSAGGVGAVTDADRGWPTLELAVWTLFDPEFWLLAPAVAVVAIALAFLARGRVVALYAATYVVAAIAAATLAIWSERFPITQDDAQNPIVRMTGTSILVLIALSPLLLEHAWSAGADARRSWRASRVRDLAFRRSLGAWAIVIAAALVVPVSVAAGYSGQTLPGGTPQFPSTSDCVREPVAGEDVRLVLGYAGSYSSANELQARATAAGLKRVRASQDGCGRLRVFVEGVSTVAAARPLLDEARAAGLEPTLELAS